MKRSKDTPTETQDAHASLGGISLVSEFMHTWFKLGQAIKRVVVPILEEHHNADFFDFMVLNLIDEGNVYPGAIAEKIVVQPSKISRTLEDLVKRNLVKRNFDSQDSRRVRLELTPEGRKVLQAVYATVRTILEPSFAEIGPDQVCNLIKAVEQMMHGISNHKHHLEPIATASSSLEPAKLESIKEVV